MTLKPQFLAAFTKVKDFLVNRGSVTADFDIQGFLNDRYLRQLFGPDYDRRRDDVANPAALSGRDDVCRLPVGDPAQASELWATGTEGTQVAATPTCLLRRIAAAESVRAAYVPDTLTGTRLFADHAVWLDDGSASATERYKPFATTDGADTYRTAHPGAKPIEYPMAITQSRSAN
jgi:NitT/TauT family transport system substrate-binding protein